MIFLLILTLAGSVKTDQCNYYATLSLTDSFYLTQPLVKTLSINIANYDNAFKHMAELLPAFQRNLHKYETLDSVQATETVNLTSFNDDFNVYPITQSTIARDAYNACSKTDGSLITFNHESKQKVVELLKYFEIDKTPFKALPFHSLFSLPDMSLLDTPKIEQLTYLYNKSPPMLNKDGEIEYPSQYKTETTTQGIKIESQASDYKSKILCMKPANPWDLPENRNKWFNLIPTIKTVIKLLDKLTEAYKTSTQSFDTLPRSTLSNTANFFKLVLPEPFQVVIDFLKKYAVKSNWERTTTSSLDQFASFASVALKLVRQFHLTPNSIINIEQKQKPFFKATTFNELNWKDLLELDEEQFGIVPPVLLIPETSYIDDSVSNKTHTNFKATVKTKIFNRKTDLILRFNVLPNIRENELTTVKQVIQTSKYSIAITDELSPTNCQQPLNELYRVCEKLPFRTRDDETVKNMITCAMALLSVNSSKDFEQCPKRKANDQPIMYRAMCDESEQITVIVNSKYPLNLNFVCDSKQITTKLFDTFPATVSTDCEVQIVNHDLAQFGLPQFNVDFLQDPIIGTATGVSKISEIRIPRETVLLIAVCVLAIILALALIVLIIYCIRKYLRRRHSRSQEQAPQYRPPALAMHLL